MKQWHDIRDDNGDRAEIKAGRLFVDAIVEFIPGPRNGTKTCFTGHLSRITIKRKKKEGQMGKKKEKTADKAKNKEETRKKEIMQLDALRLPHFPAGRN